MQHGRARPNRFAVLGRMDDPLGDTRVGATIGQWVVTAAAIGEKWR